MAEAAATPAVAVPDPKKVPVAMKDGRTVEFPLETKAKKATLYPNGAGALVEDQPAGIAPVGIRWDFRNGESRTVLVADVAPLGEQFKCHGISQKLGDEYASEKDVDDAVMAFDALLARLKAGEWSEKREGGFTGMSVLAKALMEKFTKTADEVAVILKTLSPQEKGALRQAPGIREIVARIEAEKVEKSKVDLSGVLNKFGAAAA